MKTIKKLRFIFILLCVSVLFTKVVAQETFFRTYPFNSTCGNMGFSIEKAEDGGFYIGGGYACQMFMNDWMHFKTDEHGDVEWMTRFASTMSPWFYDMLVTEDGMIYSVGDFFSHDEYEYFPGIGKISTNGDSIYWGTNCKDGTDTCQWSKGTYNSIYETANGDFLLAGEKEGCTTGRRHLLSRITPDGETVWTVMDTLFYMGMYRGTDALETTNGDIYAVGRGANNMSPYWNHTHAFFAKYNSNGERVFLKTFEEEGSEERGTFITHIEQQNDLFVLVGNFWDWGIPRYGTPFLYQITQNGSILKKAYINIDKEFELWADETIMGITSLQDGGFLVVGAGQGRFAGAFNYGFMTRFNADLEQIWYKIIGDTTEQEFAGWLYDATELSDGRLAFTGYTKTQPDNAKSFLLVTDAWGNGDYPSFERPNTIQQTNKQCIIYPNPTSDYLFIDPGDNALILFSIYSITGNLLKTGSLSGKTRLDLSNSPPGVFVLKMKGYAPKKIVLSE